MLTLEQATKNVADRERGLARAEQNLETARAAVAEVRLHGDGTKRDLIWQVKAAEARVREAELTVERARESVADARRVLDLVTAHAKDFAQLAEFERRIAERQAALVALGVETRTRLNAEVVALRQLLGEANTFWATVNVHARIATGVPMPREIAPLWSSVAPGRDDLLFALAHATRAATGSPS